MAAGDGREKGWGQTSQRVGGGRESVVGRMGGGGSGRALKWLSPDLAPDVQMRMPILLPGLDGLSSALCTPARFCQALAHVRICLANRSSRSKRSGRAADRVWISAQLPAGILKIVLVTLRWLRRNTELA